MYGFYRIATAVPAIIPGDVEYNCNEIIRLYRECADNGASLVFFPRLAVSGASCGELFFQPELLKAARNAVEKIAGVSDGRCIAVFGTPGVGCCDESLADAFAVAAGADKLFMVANRDGDSRFFDCSCDGGVCGSFDCGFSFSLNSSGAENAEIELISLRMAALPGSSDELQMMARSASRKSGNVVVVNAFCAGESTAGKLYSSASAIACDGKIIASTPMLSDQSMVCYADVDLEALQFRRRRNNIKLAKGKTVVSAAAVSSPDLRYADLAAHPYLPEDPAALAKFCSETLELQSFALCRRMKAAFADKMILGISGGLDSTLALVVLNRCCELLGRDKSNIIAVTMPGFGTTGRTRNNALALAGIIGASIREIPIEKACVQHFADIGHDPEIRNAVYENTQARERTQILMDIANAENGLVIGTGDLSELALGWCTYNGDQMSMYSLNSTVMKSVIPKLLEFEAGRCPEMAEILQDVIATPVSPELIPPENGTPGHCTEEILGAYELHDFFIWHFAGNGAGREKLEVLAEIAFGGKYGKAEIRRCLDIFMRRFFSQQFKRSASPEGVDVNAVSLNPGFWRMPSDISGKLFKNP